MKSKSRITSNSIKTYGDSASSKLKAKRVCLVIDFSKTFTKITYIFLLLVYTRNDIMNSEAQKRLCKIDAYSLLNARYHGMIRTYKNKLMTNI
jgi:hypothetical protein